MEIIQNGFIINYKFYNQPKTNYAMEVWKKSISHHIGDDYFEQSPLLINYDQYLSSYTIADLPNVFSDKEKWRIVLSAQEDYEEETIEVEGNGCNLEPEIAPIWAQNYMNSHLSLSAFKEDIKRNFEAIWYSDHGKK